MTNLNNLLPPDAPAHLRDLLSFCKGEEDLVNKTDSSQAISLLQNMPLKGNESLAARLLTKLDPNKCEIAEVKSVETALRNQGMLNRKVEPDISLITEDKSPITAHKSILALEAPRFMAMRGFKEFQDGKIIMEETGIPREVYQHVFDILYLSDEKRKEFISKLDKALLPQMAMLSSYWGLESLKELCDDELCNSLAGLEIDKDEIQEWVKRSDLFPKFTLLLQFMQRAGKGNLEPIIDQMQTPAGAAQLAAKCTPKEIVVFATLKTELGKACQIPPGTFGKAEWEKTFPVTIEEVPPLPPNIHAILEQEDPCEPGKKLKETCMLFLRPESVTLHEKESDKELLLTFDNVEKLAQSATNEKFRTKYDTFRELRDQMNKTPVAKAAWVLIRKDLIPDTRGRSFEDQKKELKGNFEVPLLMDAVLLNILVYASEGEHLYGKKGNFWIFTRCQEPYTRQEPYKQWQTVVGFDPKGLEVGSRDIDRANYGLSAFWKF